MYFWSAFPFIRITAAFISGILLVRFFEPDQTSPFLIYMGIGGALLWFLLIFIKKRIDTTMSGIIMMLILASLGGLRLSFYSKSDELPRLTNEFASSQAYIGRVISYPSQKSDRVNYILEAQQAIHDGKVVSVEADLSLTVRGNRVFQYGDKLLLEGSPQIIKGAKNPNAFDYAQYMADQNIFFQQWLPNEKIQLIERNTGNPLMESVYRIRNHFESVLSQNVSSIEERGIVLALLLGIKDRLDYDTKEAYATAGAMHVLAVSGLHVGIIYMGLLWLLQLIRSPFFQKWFTPSICILVLWFYALLTGFSPSIFRAVCMFTVIIVGQQLQRSANIYNSISVSAFILLLANPTHLFSVGFQLSYLAVIGIVFIYDKLYHLITAPTWLGDKAWSLMCVSIAAQMATTPISIYYFHQFPTYFWLTNLFIIPIAFVLMVLGILVLIFGALPGTSWLGWLLEKCIFVLNYITRTIANFNGSRIEWLYLSPQQVVIIYICIVTFFAFLHFRKTQFLWATFCGIILISGLGTYSIWQQSQKKLSIFYSLPTSAVFDHIEGLNSQTISTDHQLSTQQLDYNIVPYHLSHHLPYPTADSALLMTSFQFDGQILHVKDGRKYLFVSKRHEKNTPRKKMETDYLIVSNNSIQSFDELKNSFDFKTLILDNTNYPNHAIDIIAEAKQENIEVHYLREKAVIFRN